MILRCISVGRKSCKVTFNPFSKFLVLGAQVRDFLFNQVHNLKPVQKTLVFIKFIFLLQFGFYNIHWIWVDYLLLYFC